MGGLTTKSSNYNPLIPILGEYLDGLAKLTEVTAIVTKMGWLKLIFNWPIARWLKCFATTDVLAALTQAARHAGWRVHAYPHIDQSNSLNSALFERD